MTAAVIAFFLAALIAAYGMRAFQYGLQAKDGRAALQGIGIIAAASVALAGGLVFLSAWIAESYICPVP